MKFQPPAALAALSLLLAHAALAGQPVKEKPAPPVKAEFQDDKAPKAPWRSWLPDAPVGNFTLGAMFSQDRAGVYLDGITGLWAPESRDAFLFLDGRYHYEDGGQFISSTGLGFRKLLTGHDVIIGANVFWDAISSDHDNDFNQLGFGIEVLTKWVDARFNYYLPENDRYEISRNSSRSSRTSFTPGGILNTTQHDTFRRYESSLEGFNAEVGFLIPGLDKYAEVRAYAGYYHYDNPFGGDFDGFKARLEARVLRGVTANVEYWDDERLMGGHWTGEIAVSVPFSIYNLFTGKNPFEGASDSFKRVPRPFSDRMSDMIDRSHRIQTVTSDNIRTDRSTSSRFTPIFREEPVNNGGGGGFPIE